MRALVLALVLASAPTPVQKARELVGQKAWEELYLAFSAGEPEGYSTKERQELRALLSKGATALERTDKVMAFSLAERAVVYEATPESLLLLARTARAAQQRGSAEAALRRGVEAFPQDPALRLELGRLLVEDKDHEGAVAALEKISARSKLSGEAKRLLDRARAEVAKEREAQRTIVAVEKRIHGTEEPGRSGTKTAGGKVVEPEVRTSGLSYESGVGPGGMRTRSNRRFTFRYFNNDRDFGQRAEYEGQVAQALEEAYVFSKRVLGEARETPVDVILYTREEFMTHHGAYMARAVAGFYGDNAIRMNDAAELNRQNKATLVHEYVHAAVDELAGNGARTVPLWVNEGLAEYVEWRYLGADGPPSSIAARLRGAAVQGRIPSLSSMADRALISQADPGVAYATSAMAVRLLLSMGGMPKFLDFLRDVGAGMPVDDALSDRYGRTLARLDEEVAHELKQR